MKEENSITVDDWHQLRDVLVKASRSKDPPSIHVKSSIFDSLRERLEGEFGFHNFDMKALNPVGEEKTVVIKWRQPEVTPRDHAAWIDIQEIWKNTQASIRFQVPGKLLTPAVMHLIRVEVGLGQITYRHLPGPDDIVEIDIPYSQITCK